MNLNPTLSAWLDGCTQIRKVWGGYVFVWQRPDGSRFEKELKAGEVTNRAYDANGQLVNTTTMPIDIGVTDIIKASLAIKKSGKLKK